MFEKLQFNLEKQYMKKNPEPVQTRQIEVEQNTAAKDKIKDASLTPVWRGF